MVIFRYRSSFVIHLLTGNNSETIMFKEKILLLLRVIVTVIYILWKRHSDDNYRFRKISRPAVQGYLLWKYLPTENKLIEKKYF